jgi:hypothetical protein
MHSNHKSVTAMQENKLYVALGSIGSDDGGKGNCIGFQFFPAVDGVCTAGRRGCQGKTAHSILSG